MKSNSLIDHLWLLQRVTLLTVCTLGCLFVSQQAIGQSDNAFPTPERPLRDRAIIPADFQREFDETDDTESFANGSNNRFEDFAMQALGGEEAQSLVHGVKSQLVDLDIPRVFGSLAIVLGGYFGLVWFTRRFGGRGNGRLPNEVVEVLGQTPFKPGSNLQLVRLGSKLLLLLNSNEGTHTIGEISDPDEVATLCAKCGVPKPKSLAQLPSATVHSNSSTSGSPQATNTDLRQILRQLQHVADGGSRTSVFEA